MIAAIAAKAKLNNGKLPGAFGPLEPNNFRVGGGGTIWSGTPQHSMLLGYSNMAAARADFASLNGFVLVLPKWTIDYAFVGFTEGSGGGFQLAAACCVTSSVPAFVSDLQNKGQVQFAVNEFNSAGCLLGTAIPKMALSKVPVALIVTGLKPSPSTFFFTKFLQ